MNQNDEMLWAMGYAVFLVIALAVTAWKGFSTRETEFPGAAMAWRTTFVVVLAVTAVSSLLFILEGIQ